MTYVIFTSPSCSRALKKLPSSIKKHLLKEINALSSIPTKGKQLKGIFRFLRCLHTTYKGTHYRIAYEVIEKIKEIHIHHTGTRENFYKDLTKLNLKPLSVSRAT